MDDVRLALVGRGAASGTNPTRVVNSLTNSPKGPFRGSLAANRSTATTDAPMIGIVAFFLGEHGSSQRPGAGDVEACIPARLGGGAGDADLLSQVTDYLPEVVLVFDDRGMLLAANASVRRLLGWEPAQLLGRHGSMLVHPDDAILGVELFVCARATGTGVKEPVPYRLLTADGGSVELECIANAVNLSPGRFVFVVTGRPARVARHAGEIFDEAATRVSAMFEKSLVAMAQVSLDGTVLRANHQLAALVRCAGPDELLGVPLTNLVSEDWDFRDAVAPAELELRPKRRTPRSVIARGAATLVHDWQGEPLYYAVQFVDITDLKTAEAELRHRSLHDPLTGLGNRATLDGWASRATLATDVVLVIDLDGFKPINDTFGHRVGDEVLRAVADRLRHRIRSGDHIARLGGDEFVIHCADTNLQDARRFADRLLNELAQPVRTSEALVQVRASIGLALGGSNLTLDDLLDRADAALYRSKSAGGGATVADDGTSTATTAASS